LAIWGSSPTDVFAAGDSGALVHFNGINWTPQSTGVGDLLVGIWGSSPADVFVVSDGGYVLHYDGTTWSQLADFRRRFFLHGIWGTTANDVFVVATTYDARALGVLLHYDGVKWSADTLVGVLFRAWGTSPTNVIAVGGSALIVRYDGVRWTQEYWGGLEFILTGVWGSAAGDVIAVGSGGDNVGNFNGVIFHFDGARWAQASGVSLDPNTWLADIWGRSSRDVFAVGGISLNYTAQGLIIHFDGQRWSREPTAVPQALSAVWGSGDEVFAVGSGGFIIRGSPL
jgi:hypothetical protein